MMFTTASLVEKLSETVRILQVSSNRLNQGMPLQVILRFFYAEGKLGKNNNLGEKM